MKKKIVEILEKHQINGFSFRGGTDKASDHSYDGFYEEKLDEYVDKEVCILEIGVAYGGSALLWHDFIPKSKLVLVDVIDNVHPDIYNIMNKDRYNFHVMDAFNSENVLELKSKYPDGFDIIIEDGPHTLESQIFAIQNYVPLLKEGGILVIEDIQTENDAQIIVNSIGDIPRKSIEIVDLRQVKLRWDDLLVVVKK
jgi:cephalosporin hydroxylase